MSARARRPSRGEGYEPHARAPEGDELYTPTRVDPHPPGDLEGREPAASQPLRAVSRKALDAIDDTGRRARPLPQVQLRSAADPPRIPARSMGRLAPPRDPREARGRRLRDTLIGALAAVLVAGIVGLSIWLIAR